MTSTESNENSIGYNIVESDLVCLITRFRVNRLIELIRAYFWYRRIRDEARCVNGLLKSVFLVQNTRTFYTLSLWANEGAILEFNTKVHSHIAAANTSFSYLKRSTTGPELWSAEFRLCAVSPFNLQWQGLDLSSIQR